MIHDLIFALLHSLLFFPIAQGIPGPGVLTSVYTITGGSTCANPAFSGTSGPYATAASITITESTAGCSICWDTTAITIVTPGSCPTNTYSSPVVISASETLHSIATQSGYTSSSQISQVYYLCGLASISGGTTQSSLANFLLWTPCTTGSDSSGYTIVGVSVYVATAAGNFYEAVYSNAFQTGSCAQDNCPGSALSGCTSSGATATANSWNTNNPSCPTLAATTDYWVGRSQNNNSLAVEAISSNCPAPLNFTSKSAFVSGTAGTWPTVNTMISGTSCYTAYMLLAAN